MDIIQDKRVCLITGMHRSGTSALASLVNHLGADLGETIMQPKDENPKGFWENQNIVNLNEKIFAQMGYRWDLIGLESWDIQTAVLNEMFFFEAKRLINDEFGLSKFIAVKDPRTVFIIPFWCEVFRSMGYRVSIIFMYRHPYEVYKSLKTRNGFSELHSDVLWLETLSSLLFSGENKILMINYNHFFYNRYCVAKKISDFLQIENLDVKKIVETYDSNSFDETLRHYDVGNIELAKTPANEMYSALLFEGTAYVMSEIDLERFQGVFKKLYSTENSEKQRLVIYLTAIESIGGKLNDRFEGSSSNSINKLLSNILFFQTDSLIQIESQQLSLGLTKSSTTNQNSDHNNQSTEEIKGQSVKSIRSYELYKDEKFAKEWLATKLHEVRTHNDWLEKKLKEEKELSVWLSDQLTETQNRTLGLINRLSVIFNDLNKTLRWKIGNTVVTLINKLRRKNETYRGVELGITLIEENYRWLRKQVQQNTSETSNFSEIATIEEIKEKYNDSVKNTLDQFFSDGEILNFEVCEKPNVSIILVLFNKAELTLACLKSLIDTNSYLNNEIIIVDNASNDLTKRLLKKTNGLTIISNKENVGFLKACNQAITHARSKATLLLNNDTTVVGNSIEYAFNMLFSDETIGAVGGKIILLDGTLQEAGSIIWNDGSCLGYGRGEKPDNFEFLFQRDVDYCSGAFLMTRTELFEKYGGFDQRFAPAYYEETDYCLSLSEMGYRVVYTPDVVVQHYEFGSSEITTHATDLMAQNKTKFVTKHKKKLEDHASPSLDNLIMARHLSNSLNKKHVLYIDDRVPHRYFGSGFPRSNFIINALADAGYLVTLYPLNFPFEETQKTLYTDINKEIEIVFGLGRDKFEDFWVERSNCYDLVWVSRPHNMEFVSPLVNLPNRSHKLIYDAEAIYTDRDIALNAIKSNASKSKSYQSSLKSEISITNGVDVIVAVSDRDRKIFDKYSKPSVHVASISQGVEINDNPVVLSKRSGLLFVGNLDVDDSPNVDSILWFYQFVWPLIKKDIPNVQLNIVGSNLASKLDIISDPNIIFHGRVENIDEFYFKTRVFIAPTRFSAGIPCKIYEAGSFGVPCVATDLLTKQLSWVDGKELFSVEVNDYVSFANCCLQLLTNNELWALQHTNIMEAVAIECDPANLTKKVQEIITSL